MAVESEDKSVNGSTVRNFLFTLTPTPVNHGAVGVTIFLTSQILRLHRLQFVLCFIFMVLYTLFLFDLIRELTIDPSYR